MWSTLYDNIEQTFADLELSAYQNLVIDIQWTIFGINLTYVFTYFYKWNHTEIWVYTKCSLGCYAIDQWRIGHITSHKEAGDGVRWRIHVVQTLYRNIVWPIRIPHLNLAPAFLWLLICSILQWSLVIQMQFTFHCYFHISGKMTYCCSVLGNN